MSTEADIVERLARVDAGLARQLGDSIATNARLKAENERLRAERDAAARLSGTVAWLRNSHTEEDPAWVPCLKGDPGAIAFIATEGADGGV